MRDVPAAGTLPWRLSGGRLEVALVHRPRYDDWSWPKGKLDPDEQFPVAGARETEEETGLVVRLGIPLPPAHYTFLDYRGIPATKEVRYWAAQVIGGSGRLVNEIDEVAWLDAATAHGRLDYSRDRVQLRALMAAHDAGALATWPLIVVRHGRALQRSNWRRPDWLRPLDARGREQSKALIPLLGSYAPDRVYTSSSTRCNETVAPFAAAAKLKLRARDDLSEETFEADPSATTAFVDKLIRKAKPVVVCSHRPVLPAILDRMLAHESANRPMAALRAASRDGMAKGEALIAHLVGRGDEARLVAIERYFAEDD
ncbi:MAG: NUDIX hydrolase [Tetrasphaera jenkinsii]|jgi:8-oxo-(d)GTP phosphatase|nr:NUDIX hydrolase [Tetrasphaera jenkinsii]